MTIFVTFFDNFDILMYMSYNPQKYRQDLIKIKCSYCLSEFLGTRKRETCSKECTKQSKLRGMERHYDRHICKDCGVVFKIKEKLGKSAIDNSFINKRCKRCSETNRKNWYESRKIRHKELRRKDHDVRVEAFNLKMRTQNPMFDRTIVDKMRETLKKRILSGELSYKTGPSHHLWKGNRDNNHTIRTRLKEWKMSVLNESEYRCSSCGTKDKLEIHHTEPLRDIIKKFSTKPLRDYVQNSEEFESLIFVLIEYHKYNKVGKCLCCECHAKVDPQRRHTLKK